MNIKRKPARTKKSVKPATKIETLHKLIKRPKGATLSELQEATNWQAHSVRGAISGTLKKKLGISITSDVIAKRGRVYSIAESNESGAPQ